jgi:VanZ family protein
MNKRRLTFLRISFSLVLLGITYLSLKTPTGNVHIQFNDKVGHFIAYAVLTFNAFLVFALSTKARRNALLMALVGYGLLMEYLQGFVPGREVSGFDLLANSLGVAIGWGMFSAARRYFERQTNG